MTRACIGRAARADFRAARRAELCARPQGRSATVTAGRERRAALGTELVVRSEFVLAGRAFHGVILGAMPVSKYNCLANIELCISNHNRGPSFKTKKYPFARSWQVPSGHEVVVNRRFRASGTAALPPSLCQKANVG